MARGVRVAGDRAVELGDQPRSAALSPIRAAISAASGATSSNERRRRGPRGRRSPRRRRRRGRGRRRGSARLRSLARLRSPYDMNPGHVSEYHRRQGDRSGGPRRGPRAVRRGSRRRPPAGPRHLLVGDDPASAVYVASKQRLAEVGIESFAHELPADVSEQQVVEAAGRSSMPTRGCRDPAAAADAGTHRRPAADDADRGRQGCRRPDAGIGRAAGKGLPGLRPCTPAGVIELLQPPRGGARGRRGGRRGTLGSGRQAGRGAAAGRERDGDDLPFAHPRPRRGLPPRRYSGRRRRPARDGRKATGSSPARR